MGKKNDYRQYLNQTLGGLIDELTISALRKSFLKNRWLDQLLWLEGRAKREQNRYYRLKLIAIVGGTLVPAMVGFNGFQGTNDNRLQTAAAYAAFGISQTVAISVALEEFFAHGKKYLAYRNTAESLKSEGWQYFQLAGPYQQHETHEDAYTQFAQRIEQYIQQDVKGFVTSLEENKADERTAVKVKSERDSHLALQKLNQTLDTLVQAQAQGSPQAYPNRTQHVRRDSKRDYISSQEGSAEYRSSEHLSYESAFDEYPADSHFSGERSEIPSNEMPSSEMPSSEMPSSESLPNSYLEGEPYSQEYSQHQSQLESYLTTPPINSSAYYSFDENYPQTEESVYRRSGDPAE